MYAILSELRKKSIQIFILTSLTALLFGCHLITSTDTADNQPEVGEPKSKPSDQLDPFKYQGCVYPSENLVQACTKKGGEFSRVGMAGCYMCIVTYSDAGKSCRDASDCEGSCKAKQSDFFRLGSRNVTGECASNSSPFGCYQTIEHGVAQPAYCVD